MPSLSQSLHTFLLVDRSSLTNRNYRRVLGHLVDALGPVRDVSRVSYEDLTDYFHQLTNEPLGGHPIKPATAGQYLNVIQTFFNWCVRRGYLERSPADDLHVRRRAADPMVRSRAIPPDELARMIDAARYKPRDYAIMLFLADTGCRVGGLCSLQLDHLDLETQKAVIFEKGGKWHTVYYGDLTAEALRHWLAVRPPCGHTFVFTLSAGKGARPVQESHIAYLVESLSKRVGASRIWSPHAIRHSVGHALAKRGVPPSLVQRKLGHSKVSTTLDYYYPQDDAYLQAVSRDLSLASLRAPEPPPEKPVIRLDKGDKKQSATG